MCKNQKTVRESEEREESDLADQTRGTHPHKESPKQGVVAHVHNSSSWKAEAGRFL